MPLPDDFYDRYPHLREEEPDYDELPPLPPQVRPARKLPRPRRTATPEREPDPREAPFLLGHFVILQLVTVPVCFALPLVLGDPEQDHFTLYMLFVWGLAYGATTVPALVVLRQHHPAGFAAAIKFVLLAVGLYLFAVYAALMETTG